MTAGAEAASALARPALRAREVFAALIIPPGIRAPWLALTHALGVALFGGTATYVVTWLVGVTGDPLASSYYVIGANVVVLLAALAI